ncbi:MAG: hypothetical protein ACYCZR_01220 [Burkholderiales bacterium]
MELDGGDILYALQLLVWVYLACLNWNTKRVCVPPVERWVPDNLRDCIDGAPLLSLDRCIGDVIAKVAKQQAIAPTQSVQTTH